MKNAVRLKEPGPAGDPDRRANPLYTRQPAVVEASAVAQARIKGKPSLAISSWTNTKRDAKSASSARKRTAKRTIRSAGESASAACGVSGAGPALIVRSVSEYDRKGGLSSEDDRPAHAESAFPSPPTLPGMMGPPVASSGRGEGKFSRASSSRATRHAVLSLSPPGCSIASVIAFGERVARSAG